MTFYTEILIDIKYKRTVLNANFCILYCIFSNDKRKTKICRVYKNICMYENIIINTDGNKDISLLSM